MLHSILSVLGGFAAIVLLVMPTTILTAKLMLGVTGREAMMKMTPTPKFIAVNLVLSALFGVFGGFITASLADHAPMKHGYALAGFMFVMGIVSFLQNLKMKTTEGCVYGGTLVFLGPASALLGAWLQSR